jgi:hypothetical protein
VHGWYYSSISHGYSLWQGFSVGTKLRDLVALTLVIVCVKKIQQWPIRYNNTITFFITFERKVPWIPNFVTLNVGRSGHHDTIFPLIQKNWPCHLDLSFWPIFESTITLALINFWMKGNLLFPFVQCTNVLTLWSTCF